jgi:hypothetical protein
VVTNDIEIAREGNHPLMAWIEVHEELRNHPKVNRLAKDMGVSRAEARGWIVGLWLWSATYAQDGDLSEYTDDEIAEAMEYEGGNIQGLLQALVRHGLLDGDGGRRIHDWEKHGLRMLESSRKRQERFRQRVDAVVQPDPAKPVPQPEDSLSSESADSEPSVTLHKRDANVTVTSFLPNLTIPNQPNQKQQIKDPDTKPEKAPEVIDCSWLQPLLLEEWGKEGRIGYGIMQRLAGYVKERGREEVEYAIREAGSHNKRSFAYVEAILRKKAAPRASPATADLRKCRVCGYEWDPYGWGTSLCPLCADREKDPEGKKVFELISAIGMKMDAKQKPKCATA